jgi:SH3-like domain-containing protein
MGLRRFCSMAVLAGCMLGASVSTGFSAKDMAVTTSGLPVEITAEFENWRRVRDSEGAEGWVYHSLLSGRRTAVITMKTKDELAPLYDRADPTSAVAARLQAGVVAQVKRCAAGWCHVSGDGFDGWVEQQRLWGVYADEKVD